MSSTPKPAVTGLTTRVVRGSSWVMLSTAVSRVLSFGSQVVLGYLLSKHDFGVYGFAVAITAVITVLRDGGVRQVLIARPDEYPRLAGPAFWLSVLLGSGLALALLVIAVVLRVTSHPEVFWLLIVIASVQPIVAAAGVVSAKLQMDLRFGEFTTISTVSAGVRYVGTPFLAWAGLGPLSFVLPLIPASFVDLFAPWSLTRTSVRTDRNMVRVWRSLMGVSWWVVAGSAGIAAVNNGVPAVIAAIVPASVVGVYFFAQQIVVQLGILMGATLGQVLFPAFSRIKDETDRKRQASLRALRQIMMIAAPACTGLSAVIAPLELFIWHGKWADAIQPIIIMGFTYPMVIVVAVPMAVQQARSAFRAWCIGTVSTSLLSFIASGIGAKLWGTPSAIALCGGVATSVSYALYTVFALRPLGAKPARVLWALVPGWSLASIAAVVVLFGDRTFQAFWPPLLRVAACGCEFVLCYALLIRLTAPAAAGEAVNLLPGVLREPARGLLRFRAVRSAPEPAD